MIIQIIYNLTDNARSYEELYQYIRSLGECHHVTANMWWVDLHDPETAVLDMVHKVRPMIEAGDMVYIEELNPNVQRDGWLPSIAWQWLRERFNNAK